MVGGSWFLEVSDKDITVKRRSVRALGAMRTLNREELRAILVGAAILGSGGGGSLELGLKWADELWSKNLVFRLASFEEVPDAAWIAVPYTCGTASPAAEEGFEELERMLSLKALKALEQRCGREVHGIMPTELGALNVAEAFCVAASLGKYLIDADPAGRSVPELSQSTFHLFNVPITPFSVATSRGELAVFTCVADDERAEELVRALAVASGGSAGVADHFGQALSMKNAVIHGSISRAMRIGQASLSAAKPGAAASHMVEGHGAVVLFRGDMVQFHHRSEDGFTTGEMEIQGTGCFDGQRYGIWFKNENLISWWNGEPDVVTPDLICVFDDDTNLPCTNPDLRMGMRVSVVGFPSPEIWRTKQGLALMGPQHFGFDMPYRPVESLRHRG